MKTEEKAFKSDSKKKYFKWKFLPETKKPIIFDVIAAF